MNKRKRMIAEHALSLFLEKGIRQTSIQDIIERAGISKGTFYNYFASKNECVGAILEQIRYEAGLIRSELLIGKDPKDIELFIGQISVLARMSEKRGLHAMFEEIFHSGDLELKKLVLRHRLFELEWLAGRMVDIFGEPLRPYAFESAVLFHGMLHHLLFAAKIIHQSSLSVKTVASSVMRYMRHINDALIHDQTAVLDLECLRIFKEVNLREEQPNVADMIAMLQELSETPGLTKKQLQLTQALLREMNQRVLRDAVIEALLQPFTESFKDSPHYQTAKEISSTTWYYLKRQQLK